MATPEVVSDLVTEAEVADGAGLLCHGECQPIVVGVKVGRAAARQIHDNQRRGISCVPQGMGPKRSEKCKQFIQSAHKHTQN